MMFFTLQQEAVMQVIWTFRQRYGSDQVIKAGDEPGPLPDPPDGWKPGDIRRLNQRAVVQRTNILLAAQTPEGVKPKTVARSNWTNQKANEEWKGIYQAIRGEEPIPQEVEDAIASFGETDATRVHVEQIQLLTKEVAEKDSIIRSLVSGREDFENKAYTQQFVDHETLELVSDLKKKYGIAQQALDAAEKSRIKYELRNKKLRDELDGLTKNVNAIGLSGGAKEKAKHRDFSPNLSGLKADSATLLKDYRELSDKAWDTMLKTSSKTAPDYIFLVFHKFNIDVKKFIKTTIPLPGGVTSYVFASYQPHASKRERLLKAACDLTKNPHIKPIVFLVEGDPLVQTDDVEADSNLVQFPIEKHDVVGRLHALMLEESRGIDPYNPVREGFRQVWIIKEPV
jgi:hypothetical protein